MEKSRARAPGMVNPAPIPSNHQCEEKLWRETRIKFVELMCERDIFFVRNFPSTSCPYSKSFADYDVWRNIF